jgi:IS30 family transposase
METDLAFMKPFAVSRKSKIKMLEFIKKLIDQTKFQGNIGFLLLVDGYSRKIWAELIKNKFARTIRKILEKIFDSINGPITELASDSGTEFIGNREFFKERHIYYRCKYGKGNKFLMNRLLSKFSFDE